VTIYWNSTTAFNPSEKRIGCVEGSGDGLFRAFIIDIDIRDKHSIGDYTTVEKAMFAIERYYSHTSNE
jgi:hypothetical protein